MIGFTFAGQPIAADVNNKSVDLIVQLQATPSLNMPRSL